MLELETSETAYNLIDIFKDLQLAVLQMLERDVFFISIDKVTLSVAESALKVALNLFWPSYSICLHCQKLIRNFFCMNHPLHKENKVLEICSCKFYPS